MADRLLKVTLSIGEPFPTDETCPNCGFDCVMAVLVLVNNSPRFTHFCGRTVCRDTHGRFT